MAIPSSLRLEIVSAERSLVNEQVDEVQIPGANGYLGILPGHTQLLTTMEVGTLWYRQGSEKHYLAIAYGFAEVRPDHVTVLAQIAEKAGEIDVPRAEIAKKRAEERLAKPTLDMDFERARIALLKALARLQAATQSRTRA
jgi:F-type H+-transporting ATPase subunit epsilon